MMKKLSILLGSVLLAGCNSMTGSLSVSQALKVNYTPYADGSPALNTKVLERGDYTTKISSRGHELVLRIQDGSNLYVPFHVPAGVNLPGDAGEFKATATNGSQSFDITGKVDTQETASEPQSGMETCDLYDPGQCWGSVSCGVGSVMQGEQQVTFRVVTAHKTMSVEIAEANSSGSPAATFYSQKTYQYRDYLYRGPCF